MELLFKVLALSVSGKSINLIYTKQVNDVCYSIQEINKEISKRMCN